MRITNLIEDTPGVPEHTGVPRYAHEHGFSLYIETERHKILVDTGAGDAFIANAEKKGIDLTKVDIVVISHGHYDHTSGLVAFRQINKTAAVYIQSAALGDFYNVKHPVPKYIGMDKAILSLTNVAFFVGNWKIDRGVFLFSGVQGKRLLPRGNQTLRIKKGDDYVQDEFNHEQYLVIAEGEEILLVSGCAHKGILNILDTFREKFDCLPTRVVTGFHTMKDVYDAEDDEIIEQTARELAAMPTIFHSGHCTGDYALTKMQAIMGEKLKVMHSGEEIV